LLARARTGLIIVMSAEAVAAAEKPLPQQVLAGKYRIERELGQGGMGVVYAARHVLTGRLVAIKWMLSGGNDKERSQRFMREARAAGRVDHPNVVQVLDFGEDARGPFIVMEFLQGEPLSSLLSRVRLSPAEAIDLLMPALRGVHAAHNEGVVHRDLKPDNIFLCRTRDGAPAEAKVLDFGISKLVFGGEPVDTLTRPGSLIGTPHYMAPERVRGQRETDRRSDVYSFGVILYEVLTGRLPYDTGHVGELIVRITTQPPAPPRAIDPRIPPELEAIVLKAMARRISDRYPDIESFALALEAFAGEQRFRVQRREPTGRHRSDAPTEDAIPTQTAPSVSGERPTTLEPITTLPPIGFRHGKRLAIAAALLVTVAAASSLLLSGTSDAAPAAKASEAARPPAAPAPVQLAAAPLPRRPAPSTTAAPVRAPAPPAVAQQVESSAVAAAATAAPRPAGAAVTRPAAKSAAATKTVATTSKPKAAPEPARTPKKRVRVARGVRTRGLSEQDF
jgi:serine/threonine-protein kinase